MNIRTRVRKLEAKAGPRRRRCPHCGRELRPPDREVLGWIKVRSLREAAAAAGRFVSRLEDDGKMDRCPGCGERDLSRLDAGDHQPYRACFQPFAGTPWA